MQVRTYSGLSGPQALKWFKNGLQWPYFFLNSERLLSVNVHTPGLKSIRTRMKQHKILFIQHFSSLIADISVGGNTETTTQFWNRLRPTTDTKMCVARNSFINIESIFSRLHDRYVWNHVDVSKINIVQVERADDAPYDWLRYSRFFSPFDTKEISINVCGNKRYVQTKRASVCRRPTPYVHKRRSVLAAGLHPYRMRAVANTQNASVILKRQLPYSFRSGYENRDLDVTNSVR